LITYEWDIKGKEIIVRTE